MSNLEESSTWSSHFNLYLVMLSYSTGLTIPRIASPSLLRTQIGILLLIPIQLLVMFLITVPCLFMELALGQYSNKTMIKIWDLCPILRGIGVGSFVIFLLYQTYYTFLCSCYLCFAIASFKSVPYMKSCNNSWNQINCYTLHENFTRRVECSQKYSKETCDQMEWQSSVEQFYFNRILNIDDSSGYVGTPQPELTIYLLITLAVIFFVNYGGYKSVEKFLIALAIIPTIQLFLLFFTPLTDSNALVTLNYIFTQFDITKLGSFKNWATIVNLSLNSPGLGFAAYITFGTHFTFRSPLHFKAIIISFVNVLLTILYNITIQNFLISLCVKNKMLFDDFFKLEQKLSMPEAVFFLEHSSKFWMTMWLTNCYLLGLRSLVVMMVINTEVIYTSIPKARKWHSLCTLTFSLFFYVCGIVFSTRIGYLIVDMMEKVITDFSVLFLTTIHVVGIVYIYGVRKFRDDVHFMIGIKSSAYCQATYVLIPPVLMAILIYGLYDFYGRVVSEFFWIYALKNVLIWFCLGLILVYAFVYVIFASVKKMPIVKPTSDWGPRLDNLKKSRKLFKAHALAKEYMYRQERFRLFEDE